jgi:hypothetical protein
MDQVLFGRMKKVVTGHHNVTASGTVTLEGTLHIPVNIVFGASSQCLNLIQSPYQLDPAA